MQEIYYFTGLWATQIKQYTASYLVHLVMHKTEFEIECRCGGHSVTKEFLTILQILVAKSKL